MTQSRKPTAKESHGLVPDRRSKDIRAHPFAPENAQLLTNRDEIAQLMDDAKQTALTSGQVGIVRWRLGDLDVQLLYIISQRVTQETGMQISPKQILDFVEDALKNYNFIPRLETSPLTRLLDLRRFQYDQDPPHLRQGWALRHALDEAIDAIEGSATPTEPNRGPLRAERYLSHRYRERLRHQEIAHATGWSDRSLDRLRRELLERVAGILFAPG